MLCNRIFKNAPVAKAVGVKCGCLAVFCAQALTVFLFFSFLKLVSYGWFWSAVLGGCAGSSSGESFIHEVKCCGFF